MNKPKILYLEDEVHLARIVKETLTSRGFEVVHFNNGRLGFEAIKACKDYNICVIDVMMPFMDGFTFAKQLRQINKKIPILFLTARSQDSDVLQGYSNGGNDYLRKPFSLEELILRINELLSRKCDISQPDVFEIGSFTFLPKQQQLLTPFNQTINLSHKECELLVLLSQNKNHLLDRKATLMNLWEDDNSYNARTMDVFISKLRKHFQPDEKIQIINLRGKGYKLIC